MVPTCVSVSRIVPGAPPEFDSINTFNGVDVSVTPGGGTSASARSAPVTTPGVVGTKGNATTCWPSLPVPISHHWLPEYVCPGPKFEKMTSALACIAKINANAAVDSTLRFRTRMVEHSRTLLEAQTVPKRCPQKQSLPSLSPPRSNGGPDIAWRLQPSPFTTRHNRRGPQR